MEQESITQAYFLSSVLTAYNLGFLSREEAKDCLGIEDDEQFSSQFNKWVQDNPFSIARITKADDENEEDDIEESTIIDYKYLQKTIACLSAVVSNINFHQPILSSIMIGVLSFYIVPLAMLCVLNIGKIMLESELFR